MVMWIDNLVSLKTSNNRKDRKMKQSNWDQLMDGLTFEQTPEPDLKTIEKKTTVSDAYVGDVKTLSTRVVYDRAWDEYKVLVWFDGVRHEDADYFAEDKADAIGTASAIRQGNFGRKVSA